MRISQIGTNFQTKRPSFQKVNEKFFKQAVEEYRKNAPYHHQGHLLRCIDIETYFEVLSYQDAIDTLNAIKPYAQNALNAIDGMILRLEEAIKKSSNQ